jgi:hypothetical protein
MEHKPAGKIGVILDRLLELHARAGYPGTYEAVEKEGVWHVIPLSVKNNRGASWQLFR